MGGEALIRDFSSENHPMAQWRQGIFAHSPVLEFSW